MTKETQKRRNDAKRNKQQNIDDNAKLNTVIEYMNTKKRIMKFDNVQSETINLTGDIICYNGIGCIESFKSILASATIDLNIKLLQIWMKEK